MCGAHNHEHNKNTTRAPMQAKIFRPLRDTAEGLVGPPFCDPRSNQALLEIPCAYAAGRAGHSHRTSARTTPLKMQGPAGWCGILDFCMP
jgi:hypothetical protein